MVICSNCGSKLSDKSKFCNKCGREVNKSSNQAVKLTKDKRFNKKYIIGIIILLLILAGTYIFLRLNKNSDSYSQNNTETSTSTEPSVVKPNEVEAEDEDKLNGKQIDSNSKEYYIVNFITKITENDSGKHIVVDRAYWYWADASDDVIGDYYIKNDNNELREYKLSKDVKLKIINFGEQGDSSPSDKEVSYDEFKTYVQSPGIESRVFELKLKNSEVVEVKEWYRP